MDDTQTQVRSVLATHYDGCWRDHLECAILRAEMMERQRDEWMEKHMDALGKLQKIKEWAITGSGAVRKILDALDNVSDNQFSEIGTDVLK